MQPKPVSSPPKQPALPFGIPRRAGTRWGPEEVVVGRCASEEAWETAGSTGSGPAAQDVAALAQGGRE
ncbi:MAG TPA: hypothetical protein VE288_12590 [Rubrobacteraceae bacterium]|jgi:hypothetical protein|nr:hypothetical protein [Rubrobacteraceae bacterium]